MPAFLIVQAQQMKLVIRAQVRVVERSEVVERRTPVIPIRDPNIEERKSAPIYGVQ